MRHHVCRSQLEGENRITIVEDSDGSFGTSPPEEHSNPVVEDGNNPFGASIRICFEERERTRKQIHPNRKNRAKQHWNSTTMPRKYEIHKTLFVSLLACYVSILQRSEIQTTMAFQSSRVIFRSRRGISRTIGQKWRTSQSSPQFSVKGPLGLSKECFPRFASTCLCSTSNDQSSDDAEETTKTQYTIDDSVCLPTKPETLEKAVHKSCRSLEVYLEKKPTAAHTKRAFEILVDMIGENNVDQNFKGIVLDSGCGTGRSTKLLANDTFPEHLVIGVDRSLARLTKTKDNRQGYDDNSTDEDDDQTSERATYCQRVSENAYLVRAELVDFWRCCMHQGWTSATDGENKSSDGLKITHHYILYPNPYPTNARLSSRWYAHPSFPLILTLGIPTLVLRSNWEGYLSEFAQSVQFANDFYATSDPNNVALPYLDSAMKGPAERIDKSVALTNFESKYDAVGERTFELILERKEP